MIEPKMVMKNNGNYELEEPFYKHDCKTMNVDDDKWHCFMKSGEKILTLRLTISQCCHDDEYDIKVKMCPICNYKIEDTK